METNEATAAALLQWYRAMGVDEAIAGAPLNWFEAEPPFALARATQRTSASVPPKTERRAPAPAPSMPNAPSSSPTREPESGDVMAARELARKAQSLAELRRLVEDFEGCALKKSAIKMCFSRGSEKARVMFIGEAPGKEEDAQGIPFVGRAGKLLDQMLAAAGLDEDDVYITNLVYWRPPGNRTPSHEEMQICQPFLERQIELLEPEILVFLGNSAAKQLTGATEGIIKLRGKWLTYPPGPASGQGRTTPAMATLHPAYLLRNPIAKRLAWRDLLLIREALDKRQAANKSKG
jgi:DNA polymerase